MMSATIYILREVGPTGFLLKEESETRNVQVFLGDPHRCTCATFKKEKDLCKHICWVLLKKFRLSPRDPSNYLLVSLYKCTCKLIAVIHLNIILYL